MANIESSNELENVQNSYTDEEMLEILKRFQQNLIDNSKQTDPEIQQIMNESFWDMFESF